MTPGETPSDPAVTVIIPALNEAGVIGTTLDAVARVRGPVEVIVVDGGSDDGTAEIAHGRGVRLVKAPRGRGPQMHAGAGVARGKVLLFLHADTHPPPEAVSQILGAMADPTAVGGSFSVRFDSTSRAARTLAWVYRVVRRLGVCYGDSGIFVRRDAYERAGGFRPYPLFEDADLLRRLRRLGRLVRLPAEVVTSARRFEERNFTLTFALWSVLQTLYWLGVPPRLLGRLYPHVRRRRAVCPRGSAAPPGARGLQSE